MSDCSRFQMINPDGLLTDTSDLDDLEKHNGTLGSMYSVLKECLKPWNQTNLKGSLVMLAPHKDRLFDVQSTPKTFAEINATHWHILVTVCHQSFVADFLFSSLGL